MSYTQGSIIIENANHTYNANDKNKAKHIETNKVNDYLYTKYVNHKQKLSLVRLIFQRQVHTNLDNGNEIESEV